MLLDCDIDQKLMEQFKMALRLRGTTEQVVLEQMIKAFTSDSFAKTARELSASTGLATAANSSCNSLPISEATVTCSKAFQRIPLWAKRPDQINSRILRAYFACEHDGTASKVEMAKFFKKENSTDATKFERNFSSMCTETGNSHGKVFSFLDDIVHLYAPIEPLARQYQHYFYST